ncbi:MAG: carboxypeptidase-like regulatory domain-containing protein, partial [Acidobacteria bacterium]|nr:carboxypeptidase-like regulatory domain-containing protein [Acidobacteriota bacterium]
MKLVHWMRMGVVLATLAGMAFAQEYRASISGTVTDPTSAAVVGAKVTVTDVLKNTRTEVVTNAVGFYSVPFLLPSRYKLTVEASGFKKFVREDIVLGVNDKLGLDVALEVGALADSVTVTGEAAILQTETASRGGVVEQRLVEDLP